MKKKICNTHGGKSARHLSLEKTYDSITIKYQGEEDDKGKEDEGLFDVINVAVFLHTANSR